MRKQVRRRVEKVADNRAALLEAARVTFLARGYVGATLEAIAEEAGFSKGVVYSQFSGKPDLFLALLERRIDERAAENEAIAARLPVEDVVPTLLRNFERDAHREAGWARLLIEFRTVAMRDPELGTRYAELHRRTRDRLESLLAGVHARLRSEPPVSPRAMAEFILALGPGLVLERAADRDALAWPELIAMAARALGFVPHDALAADTGVVEGVGR
jgi:AcrR family transcriptional regulator